MVEFPKAFRELERLVCPVCHEKLLAAEDAVVCTGCSRRYPVIDGIAALLADRAV